MEANFNRRYRYGRGTTVSDGSELYTVTGPGFSSYDTRNEVVYVVTDSEGFAHLMYEFELYSEAENF